MMKARHTFHDLDYRVGAAREYFVYGPESARAYVVVTALHNVIRQRQRKAEEIISPIWRVVYLFNGGDREACRLANISFMTLFPGLWEQKFPCRLLTRAGYNIMKDAADRDTEAYYAAMDAGLPEPFVLCDSPREAYERYRLAA